MALIILEGLDRTGKTTVARFYEEKGYEYIHQSAPSQEQTPEEYLDEQIKLIQSAVDKDIVLDRSYYGEMVWPVVYGRESLLTPDGLAVLREVEGDIHVTRILMTDPDPAAHWQRCADNNEPITRKQFAVARRLFNEMANKYNFHLRTIYDFPQVTTTPASEPQEKPKEIVKESAPPLTKEQKKLEVANAINAVLNKRILRQKGGIYDSLEKGIRSYLNTELAKIFGNEPNSSSSFSEEEVQLLKFFCERLKEQQR